MRLSKVKEVLKGTVKCGDEYLDREVNAGCGCDLMSHVLSYIKIDNTLLVTGLIAPQTIFIADAANVKAICFVRGNQPTEETIQLARQRKMVLISANLPLYEACGRLYKEGLIGCSEYESNE